MSSSNPELAQQYRNLHEGYQGQLARAARLVDGLRNAGMTDLFVHEIQAVYMDDSEQYASGWEYCADGIVTSQAEAPARRGLAKLSRRVEQPLHATKMSLVYDADIRYVRSADGSRQAAPDPKLSIPAPLPSEVRFKAYEVSREATVEEDSYQITLVGGKVVKTLGSTPEQVYPDRYTEWHWKEVSFPSMRHAPELNPAPLARYSAELDQFQATLSTLETALQDPSLNPLR